MIPPTCSVYRGAFACVLLVILSCAGLVGAAEDPAGWTLPTLEEKLEELCCEVQYYQTKADRSGREADRILPFDKLRYRRFQQEACHYRSMACEKQHRVSQLEAIRASLLEESYDGPSESSVDSDESNSGE